MLKVQVHFLVLGGLNIDNKSSITTHQVCLTTIHVPTQLSHVSFIMFKVQAHLVVLGGLNIDNKSSLTTHHVCLMYHVLFQE